MPKLRAHNCNRCGKKLTYPGWVHSSWNDNYYCPELNACAARAKRKRRATT